MLRELLSPCPLPGGGVHSWIMSSGHYCRRAGMSPAEAESFIAARITRPPKPANEVATAVAKAFDAKPDFRPRSYTGRFTAPKKLTEIQFEPAKLHAAAARIQQPRNWRHWLWERSPKTP
jgi:hypothetical protein